MSGSQGRQAVQEDHPIRIDLLQEDQEGLWDLCQDGLPRYQCHVYVGLPPSTRALMAPTLNEVPVTACRGLVDCERLVVCDTGATTSMGTFAVSQVPHLSDVGVTWHHCMCTAR